MSSAIHKGTGATRGTVMLLAVFVIAQLYAAFFKLSPAQDEPTHVHAGLSMLTGSRYVDPEHVWWTGLDALTPPADMLFGLAGMAVGQSADFHGDPLPSFNAVRAGRCVSIAVAVAMLILIFRWTRALWGGLGGLIAMVAVMMQPLFWGHAGIVSTDLLMAGGGLLAAWGFWKFWLDDAAWVLGAPGRFVLNSLLLGAVLLGAVLCKISNLAFLGIQVAVAGVGVWRLRREVRLVRLVVCACVSLVISSGFALVVAAAVWTMISPARPDVLVLGQVWPWVFGRAFVFSAQTAAAIQQLHAFPVYFLHMRPASWKFYALAVVLKTPWPLLVVWGVAPILLWRSWAKFDARQRAWIGYLLALAAGMLVLFSTRGAYLGLRHLLLPLALLGICVAPLARVAEGSRAGRSALSMGCALLGMLNGLIYPWQLSYFNFQSWLPEPVPLVDSDGDWGQGLLALRNWQRAHPNETLWLSNFSDARPEDFGIRYRGLVSPLGYGKLDPDAEKGRDPKAVTGYVALSATQRAGVMMYAAKQSADYFAAWRGLKPVALLGGSIYLYDRTGSQGVKK